MQQCPPLQDYGKHLWQNIALDTHPRYREIKSSEFSQISRAYPLTLISFCIYFYSALHYVRVGSTPITFLINEHKLKHKHKYMQQSNGEKTGRTPGF